MDRSVARFGAWAGWLSLIGILGYHLALTVLAGQRVTGTTDAEVIRAYYGHSVIAVLGVKQFLVVVPVLVFVVALREIVATSPVARLAASVAVAAVVAETAVILTEIAAQTALVTATQAGEPVVGLFRFWDALYNSGVYVLKATWILAFGLAMRGLAVFPRGTWALSVIAGATPTPRPSARASATAAAGSSTTSVWKVTLSAPARANASKWSRGSLTMRWQSSARPQPRTNGEIEARTTGPIVISGMKWPSPASKWKTRTPAAASSASCSRRREKSAA
jgi:hypothetical protein